MIDNLPNPKLPEPARNLGPTIADDDIGLTAGGRSNPMSQSLPENTSAIIRSDNSPGVDDVKQYPLFDPPNKPQRPFAADYTKGVKDDEAGNLLVDMDGDPFIAKYKVGRLTKGGDDVGLTPEQYKALAEDIIEKKIELVPRTDIDGSSGQLKYDPISNKPTRLRLANDTKVKKRNLVLGHETGHALHVKSGLKPLEPEMLEEANRNYSTLATEDEYRKALVLPPSRGGYTGARIEHELIAEAFRAALTNPNYMKTLAPKTYATLRKWIKSNSELAKLIQFNSLGATAVAAALGTTGQSDEANAAEVPPERDSQTNFPRGIGPLPGPSLPFGLAGDATKAGANGLAEFAKALSRSGLYPQAPKNEKFRDLARVLVDLNAKQKPYFYGGPR